MLRYLKLLLWWLMGAVLLCVVVTVIISLTNLNWLKPWIHRQSAGLVDRTVQIDGDLYLDWERPPAYDGWRGRVPLPVIQAHDVTVGNPEWSGTGPVMAQAQSVRLQVDVFDLTRHVVRLADLEFNGATVNLERRSDGVNNWTFGGDDEPDAESGWTFVVERLALHDSSLRVLDDTRELDVTLDVETSAARNGLLTQTASSEPDQGVQESEDEASHSVQHADYGTRWSLTGHYRGAEISGEGQTGAVLALQRDTDPFPVQGTVRIGATTLAAEGSLMRPRELAALDVMLELSGPTMADLYPILGLALPNTPPYQTAGRLMADLDAEESTWVYEEFTGTVGDSDLAGTVTYQRREPRPMLTGSLYSDLLRFEDLGPLVGAPAPGDSEQPTSNNEKASPPQLTEQEEQPDNKALPVQDADSNVWSVMDADVTFEGQRIESTLNLPLDDVRAHVVLSDSVLRFEPLDFGVAGGTFESTITLDGNVEPIKASLDGQARGLQLGQLFPGVESMDAALGTVHGDATLTSRGNSVSSLMASSSGNVSAVVSRGTVSRFLLEAAGLNVANMVFVKLFGDEQVTVQCLAAEFQIDDGLMDARTFILETDDAVVTVEGVINLATEALDLNIYPENKSLRIFTLRSPLYVAGTFKEPDVGVQTGPVAARAGAALALGVVATPLAALLPLLNVGTDDETTCAGVANGKTDEGEGTRLKGSVPGEQP